MASTNIRKCSDSFKSFLDQLQKIEIEYNMNLYNFEGFWYTPLHLEAVKSIQSNFIAKDDDIILTSSLKTGTTWLKALVYCIMGPKIFELNDDPLAKNNPHMVVPTLESQTFAAEPNPDMSGFPSPRILHTHMPYTALPDSIKNSGSKIVYIVRSPKDAFVSLWHFLNNVNEIPLDMSFERFCDGVHFFGSFFDHALQYWNESLKAPQKVMFLKYEELKRDKIGQVKRLASFLGRPLIDDEEIDKIILRSSFERLKNTEVNNNENFPGFTIPKSAFFRLGVVGDWKNTLTPDMKDRIDQITKAKFDGSGLELDL